MGNARLAAMKEQAKLNDPIKYEEEKRLLNAIKKSAAVDVLLIMDCTNSMKKHLEAALKAIE